jgi:hypothetical protein
VSEGHVIAAPDAAVYYGDGYWNDFGTVAAEINRRVSGRVDCNSVEYFRTRCGDRRFARALFLNCGNGWVEREFFGTGLLDSAVGVDYSEALLSEARQLAGDLPIRYERMDINEAQLPRERFDLIVNYAACHHVARPDRVFRAIRATVTDDAWFFNHDYVGPHRNQYPFPHWSRVWELNNALGNGQQSPLSYPHLPTMLVSDPSEAVHSELTLDTFQRYFTMAVQRPIGGALAYPLLTFNRALKRLPDDERESIIARVLQADREFLLDHPDSSLFSFWLGRPRVDALADEMMLDRWRREEDVREEAAAANGGRYYPPTLLQTLIYPDAFPEAAPGRDQT